MSQKPVEQSYRGVRVLVTGGGGFIGSRLARELHTAGADVSVVVRSKSRTKLLAPIIDAIAVYEADLKSIEEATRVISKSAPDIVFNMASSTDTRRTLDIMDSVVSDIYGVTQSVVNACIASSVKKLVHVGTIEEYGTKGAPFFETSHEAPVSPYSFGKVLATHAVLFAGRLSDLNVCVLRPAAAYGPGKSFTMLVPNIIKAGIEGKDFEMHDGEQLRDLMYVDDVVDGILRAGLSSEVNGEIINLGSGRGYKVREVAEMVNAAMGNPIRINFGAEEYRPLDNDVFYMNSDKAFALLRWKASTDIIDGIEKTVAWYREHYNDLL